MSRPAAGRALAVLVLLAAGSVRAAAQAPAPGVLSLADYVAWIDRIRDEGVGIGVGPSADTPGAVPPAWRVETPEGAFDVSNAWLIRDLRELQAGRDPEARARVRARLDALRAAAAAFETPPPDRTAERRRAAGILDSREFQRVHGPTWRDRLRQRILQFIADLLGRLFGSSAIPTISNVLVYGLITFAVAVLALWTYRSLLRTAAIESIAPDRAPVSAKAWPSWLADAQAAAARGDWRDAIRLAYWCGVSALETRGAWRPDRARTPREYLRLMPASHEHRPPLSALTRTFELVWYGTDRASEQTFREALAHLEQMGCRPA